MKNCDCVVFSVDPEGYRPHPGVLSGAILLRDQVHRHLSPGQPLVGSDRGGATR